jgi:hypothetical protein
MSLYEGLTADQLLDLGWGPEEVFGERERELFCSCPPDTFCLKPFGCVLQDERDSAEESPA